MVIRLRQFALAVAIVAVPAIAAAQSPQCDAWRGELSRLERGGGGSPRAAADAARVGAALGRAQAAFSSMKCDGSWVFQQQPPQCAALRSEIGQLRAQYSALQQQGGGGNENRRRALAAAINDNCRAGVYRTEPVTPSQQQPRTLFEALFGVPERAQPRGGMPELDGSILDPPDGERRENSWGSGRPVCVRTCDGFFFPLANSPGGSDGQDEMCRALCPAAETEVFYMAGDGDIQNASRRGGGTYAGLANAGRYLKQFDASCSCRKPGQSWAQALRDAESMLDRRRGDVLVSEQRAAEMSRPRTETPAQATQRTRREEERLRRQQAVAPQAPASDVAAEEAARRAIDEAGRNAPTAGTASAGIGPSNLGTGTVAANQGERRELTSPSGEKRMVRIVAPNLAPAIQ
ncbi:MAG: DUF2865 domain-containing protein [Hyphomicrobiales bacterium]|nr:DUF2865 domain-containing protein [Hyphomicrobiales bacterium]